jgi:hypothetical protein
MDLRLEWLNQQIDLMQADRSLDAGGAGTGYEPDAGDVSVLRMAAHFNARRAGAGQPDPEFLSSLRARVLTSIVK